LATESLEESSGTQASWTSRSGFILAAIGSAVGLGNLWRFPSEAGENGGGAFVIFYIGCVFLIGLPLLLSEILIGRHGKASAVGSAKRVARESKASPHWSALASVGMWGAFIILTFYSVVAGWVLYYVGLFAGDLFANGLGGAFPGQSAEHVSGYMGGLFGNAPLQIGLHAAFMAITIFVVMRGVNSGIERIAKWLMPAFFLLLIGITIYSLSTGEAGKAFTFLFSFQPERLFHAPVMLSALGQAFFSLSLGSAMMIQYGAYANRNTNLASTSAIIAGADTSVAIIAGLAIFPLVFAAGIDVSAGPTLMFQSLPMAFQSMPGGSLTGLLFFVMVFFAALTSSVALLEASMVRAIEKFNISRVMASLVIGGIIFTIGIGAALSMSDADFFNPFTVIPIFEGQTLFDSLDTLSGKILLPLSGLLTAIFIGWFADRRLIDDENGISGGLHIVWRFLVAWLCPVAVGLILVLGLFPQLLE